MSAGPQQWDTRAVLRVAFAIVAAQALYWLAVRPIFVIAPAPPPTYEISSASVAQLNEPTLAALDSAVFEPVELPWWTCCLGYRAARFEWTMPQSVRESGVAIIPSVDADNVILAVNGVIVRAEGRMGMEEVTHNRMRGLVFVPAGLVRDGTNRLDIIMTRAGLPYFDVGRPLIGDYRVLRETYAWRTFVFDTFEVIAYAIGFVIALIAFVVMVRAQQRAFFFWIGVLSLSWSLLAHFHFWTDPPFSPLWRLVYYFALTNMLPLAWLALADAWSERQIKWLQPFAVGAFAVAMAVTVFAVFRLAPPIGYDLASAIANWYGIAFSIAAVARFLWHIFRHRDERVMEVGVFALCISLVAFDLYAELVGGRPGGNLQTLLPLLLLALALAYLGRNVRLFQSMSAFNRTLQAKVAEREAELAEAHERERALVTRQAHEAERRRIMLDMHDGLGSQLMSLLLAARRLTLTPERMAEGLQTVIDEMRLMIESMDSVGESLPSALATFRQRIEPRVREAGMSFNWNDTSSAPAPRFGPRHVLQVFRVLQEAVSNAMKHSSASALTIAITDTDDSAFPLRISVSDNGAGLAAEPNGAGRGLDNMRKRAAAIGARLNVRSSNPGVQIVLDIPAQASAALEAA